MATVTAPRMETIIPTASQWSSAHWWQSVTAAVVRPVPTESGGEAAASDARGDMLMRFVISPFTKRCSRSVVEPSRLARRLQRGCRTDLAAKDEKELVSEPAPVGVTPECHLRSDDGGQCWTVVRAALG